MLTELTVPDSLHFGDLALERDPVTRNLRFLPGPLAELCRYNALDPVVVLADEDLSCWLICEWYLAHRESGGEPDRVVEQIVVERNAAQASGIAELQPSSGRPN